MIFFLDTNICIYLLKGRYPNIAEVMRGLSPTTIKIPAIVAAELYYGAERSSNVKKALGIVKKFLEPFELVAFCTKAAIESSTIRVLLEKEGRIIGPYDILIAATALLHGGTLVTRNTKEFNRVPGLRVVDWTL